MKIACHARLLCPGGAKALFETGHFEGEQWIVDELRSGDESDVGLVMITPDRAVHVLVD